MEPDESFHDLFASIHEDEERSGRLSPVTEVLMTNGAPGMGEPFAARVRDGRDNQNVGNEIVDGRDDGGVHADDDIDAPTQEKVTELNRVVEQALQTRLQLTLQKDKGSRRPVWLPWLRSLKVERTSLGGKSSQYSQYQLAQKTALAEHRNAKFRCSMHSRVELGSSHTHSRHN